MIYKKFNIVLIINKINMEEKSINNEQRSEQKSKINPLVALIIIIAIFGSLYLWNIHLSKKDVVDYSRKELISKGYEIIEIKLLESNVANKTKEATGKVKFLVKDKKGNFINGIGIAKNEKRWLLFNKRNFQIDSLKLK